MAVFSRKKISTLVEKQIITAMILSKEFLKEYLPVCDPSLFELPYSSIISTWCLEYYESYGDAPKENIEDIYNTQCVFLEEVDAESVAKFLRTLSDVYDDEQESFNVSYILDKAFKYTQSRKLIELTNTIASCVSGDDLVGAEAALSRFQNIKKESLEETDLYQTTEWIDELFSEDRRDSLFQFRGALGRLIPKAYRETLVLFAGPEKRGKCLSYQSLIMQPDGSLISIGDMVQERKGSVVSLDEETGRFQANEIDDWIESGIQGVYEICTRTGRKVTITAEHPLLTTFGWEKMKNISLGDEIAVPKSLPFFGNASMDRHKLILLAYIIAEGSLSFGGVSVSKKNPVALQEILDAVTEMGDQLITWPNSISHFVVSLKKKHNKYDHKDTHTRKWLVGLGITNPKSKDKIIPAEVFQQKKTSLALFLSVLFDCDGSVESSGSVSYSSASEQMIHQVQHLLLRFKVVSKIRTLTIQDVLYWKLSIRDKENVLRFIEEIGFFVEKTSICKSIMKKIHQKKITKSYLDIVPYSYVSSVLKDKMESYHITKYSTDCPVKGKLREIYMHALRRKGNLTRNKASEMSALLKDPALSLVMDSEVLWDSIVSIDYLGEQMTYDLSLKERHNFVADDVVVHNSFWLMESAISAVHSGLNVVYFNFEMREKKLHTRFAQRLTIRPEKVEDQTQKVPVFDCVHNQQNTCNKKERCCDFGIDDGAGGTIPWDKRDSGYQHCSVCEGTSDYSFAVWYEEKTREVMSPELVKKQLENLQLFTRGKTLKMQTRPSATHTVKDIENQLDIWEEEGFIADVVVVDYADLLLCNPSIRDYRHGIDDIYASLKRLAQGRKICVVSATQTTKDTYDKRMKQGNLAEDKRKAAHAERVIALNCIPGDKENGIMRLSCLFEREHNDQSWLEAIVLQCLSWGQVHLDSIIVPIEED